MSIVQAFERLALTPPKSLVDALAVRKAAAEYAMGAADAERALIDSVTSGKLTGATVVAELTAAATERVVRAAALQAHRDLDPAYTALEREAVVNSGPAIIALLRPIAAEGLDRLRAAVEIVGPVPDTKRLGNAGPVTLAALGEHREALGRLQDVAVAIGALHAARYLPVGASDVAVWLPRESTGAEVANARTVASQADGDRFAWLLAAGLDLSLNDAPQIEALLAAEQTHLAAQHRPRPAKPDPQAQRIAEDWRRLVSSSTGPADRSPAA